MTDQQSPSPLDDQPSDAGQSTPEVIEPQSQPVVASAPSNALSKEGPWRIRLLGVLLFVFGAGLQFLIMASDERFSFSVPLGFSCCALAAAGLLLATGAFAPLEDANQALDFHQLKRPGLLLL